jgi:WD40 repeat protein
MLDFATGEMMTRSFPVTYVYDITFNRMSPRMAMTVEPARTLILRNGAFELEGSLVPHLLGEKALAFLPDGARLATASQGIESLRLWDWARKEELITLEGGPFVAREVKCSANGNVIGIRDNRGTILLWRAPSWEEMDNTELERRVGSG